MKKMLFIAFSACVSIANAQIFSQNFESSSIVSDYYNETNPLINQFNLIDNTGADMIISIHSGKLIFSRTGTRNGSFSRTTDINGTNFMSMKFDIEVSGNSASTTTAAVFQFGSGFGTNNSAESIADVHSRVGINIGANTGEFSLRNIADGQSSAVFSGNQTITWVMNNTGSVQSYTSPAGGVENIASDKSDIWVGTIKVFDDASATTPTQLLTDFKFVFNGGRADIALDNIVISEYTTLPVSLHSFSGQKLKNGIELNWTTAAEFNSRYFEVLKSTDGKVFNPIGKIEAKGLSDSPGNYSFTDYHVYAGTQYYQLVQTDEDGRSVKSEIIQVSSEESPEPLLFVKAVGPESLSLVISAAKPGQAELSLSDLSGKRLYHLNLLLKEGLNPVIVPLDQAGMVLVATCRIAGRSASVKFVK